jgi:glucose/arabinose dehydrogenase/PKD repeat protein
LTSVAAGRIIGSVKAPRLLLITVATAAATIVGVGDQHRVSAAVPAGFQDTIALSGLDHPTAVRFASDGRVFVIEKRGVVKVFSSLTDTTPTVFADLRTSVFNGWDRGMMGLALDPAFPTKPYVYVLYAHDADIGSVAPKWGTPNTDDDTCPDPPGYTTDGCVISGRLSRLTAAGNVMTGAEKVLVEGWCQQYPSHSMDAIDFGSDGALYATAGEGASFTFSDYGQKGSPKNPCGDPPAGVGGVQSIPTAEGGSLRAQDLRTPGDPVGLSGTLIRVDPATGAGLPDNPLAGNSDANARRIVAYGLRNPFRFAIRPGTNDVWIGNVGNGKWEALDRVPNPTAGVRNFGWPCYEGPSRSTSFDALNLNICENLYADTGAVTPPVFSYPHGAPAFTGDVCSTTNSAISGMSFYGGSSYPAKYRGALFFSDYARHCTWAMLPGTNGLPDPTKVVPFLRGPQVVDVRPGPNGDLFYVDYTGGEVHRIRYFGGNQPPIAHAAADKTTGSVPLDVTFDATGSTDADGDPLTYKWDLDGDGQLDDSTSATPVWQYTSAGPVTVTLRATDSSGAFSDDSIKLTPGDTAPQAVIDAPSASLAWKVGDTISFSGHANDAEDGSEPASRLTWTLIMHHCVTIDDCHEHLIGNFVGQAAGSFPAPDHEYPSYLELQLTAADAEGLVGTDSVRLDPKTTAVTVASSPAGLSLGVGSSSGPAPRTVTEIQNGIVTVAAPPTQGLGGKTYTFSGWSDGGAASHEIVTPDAAVTLTATYVASPAAPLFSDGFESGTMSAWTSTSGIVAQQAQRFAGAWGAQATTTSAARTATKQLSSARTSLYERVRFKVLSKAAVPVTLLSARTLAGAPRLQVFLNPSNRLALRNNTNGAVTTSTSLVSLNAWHTLQLHTVIAGASSSTEVWIDGTKLPALSTTLPLGTAGIGRMMIGDSTTGHQFDIAFDDAAAATAFIP